jgi:hypothetical protein
MSRTRALTVGLTTATVVLGSATLAISANAQGPSHASEAHPDRSIVGTWQMTIDPLPNPGGDPPPFPSLVQFAEGGTMTDSVSSVPASPALVALGANGATSGLGAWQRRGHTITFRFERFITDNGKYVARQLVTGTTTVSKDGKSQGGPVTATFYDTKGAPLGPPAQINAEGTRLLP